jgi:ABC-type lipoprotein release transport system permease subunit
MKLSTYFLFLKKQVQNKWGRFLLASGGIMIGIWAITLTTSLSLGLSNTIITAINSQPAAKSFSISKTKNGETSFTEFSSAPEFVAIGKEEIKKIKEKNNNIVDIQPNTTGANTFLNLVFNYGSDKDKSCFEIKPKSQQQIATNTLENNPSSTSVSEFIAPTNLTEEQRLNAENYTNSCQEVTISNFVFQNFYETNKNNWLGKSEKLGLNEIALCFKCNDIGKKLGAKKPEELLGKELNLEYLSSPVNYKPNELVDVTNANFGVNEIPKKVSEKFKIVSVINDENSSGFGFSTVYIDSSYYDKALRLVNPELKDSEIGYFQLDAIVNTYDNLNSTIKSLQNDKYLPISLVQFFISGVEILFNVLSWVLSGFGIIALVASVFGIVNVMTISVLERRKEIGILKALGSRDSDIFNIFFIESAFLGVLGWLLGTILALITGFGITSIFNSFVLSNKEWRENLEALNITGFAPSVPFWLLLITLLVATLSTCISGLLPAIKASKQNPVDVLRGE